MKIAVAVADTTLMLAVLTETEPTTSVDDVDLVTPTLIVQSAVLSEAVTETSDRHVIVAFVVATLVTTSWDAVCEQYVLCCVCVTNTAVRASSFGTTSHQLVPSRPTMHVSAV